MFMDAGYLAQRRGKKISIPTLAGDLPLTLRLGCQDAVVRRPLHYLRKVYAIYQSRSDSLMGCAWPW